MALLAKAAIVPVLLSISYGVYLFLYSPIHSVHPALDVPSSIQAVLDQAQRISSHSWEYATAAEAALELHNPSLSVFGASPFPKAKVPNITNALAVAALSYIEPLVHTNGSELQSSPATIGDPPSLMPFALLLGQSKPIYQAASARQLEYILTAAPHWEGSRGKVAISHWRSHPEFWTDFLYMTPPSLAYSAVAFSNITLMQEAYQQIKLYRDVLSFGGPVGPGQCVGLWRHIAGLQNSDPGFWSTSNGWALGGMLRVYATMKSWKISSRTMQTEMSDLKAWIMELVDAIICIDEHEVIKQGGEDEPLLLRNYLDDATYPRETAGTALITASVFRAVQLFCPSSDNRFPMPTFIPRYVPALYPSVPDHWKKRLEWATKHLRTLLSPKHLDPQTGIVRPACYALNHSSRDVIWNGSAEGQSFVVLAWAAWRDCCATRISRPLSLNP